ncbi:MAG: hypothetical protein NWF06_08240 [Candidatus Bathyarchaeota archaeon]|nr:hypothetical protein [Candidatus Bathyarchaeum sp.]
MKNSSRANKGQFSVIAALLVSVILVSAVISSYTLVRHSTIQGSPEVLSAIGEMNADIKSILDFTVGYYGSILKVTGNSTYARELTTDYLSSGLVNVARSHPEWNPSFTFDFGNDDVSTCWFMPESYSMGSLSVTYSLSALGLEDVTYETSSALAVTLLESELGVSRINVIRDDSEPELGLTNENFWFYNYTDDSTWELVNPTDVLIAANGVYTITIPSGVDPESYSVQVEDNRGISVSAFYSQASVATGIPHYTYTFDWAATGVLDIYESLSSDTFVIELLQNGTLKWLGQDLELNTKTRAIPPVSVKAFRVNATINDVNQEVPFQVEDWASDYMVPLGLAGNDSIFNSNNMLVFLVNNEISTITLWWEGNDTAIQTSYAWNNVYFDDDPDSGTLDNGYLELTVNNFWIESTVAGDGSPSCSAEFLRINDKEPSYGAYLSYVIYNGVVRDIVQQEPEYSSGVSDCPNLYSHIVITFPANSLYYTYSARTIFVESESRTVTDLSVMHLDVSVGSPMTEDGTDGGYPVSSSSIGSFFDGYPTGWDHHWSQFLSGASGAGVMFTDTDNQNLYLFDSILGSETGALVVVDEWDDTSIEVNPVKVCSVSFNDSLDAIWHGAVVAFDGESIYNSGDDVGLWVMVENPPLVMLDEYDSEYDSSANYVDNSISDEDSSVDIGSHSSFLAQKAGPDSVLDTITEDSAVESENIEACVDDDTSDVDTSADVGSHSSFSAQQSGPDSVMDTLQEGNTGGGSELWVSPTGHEDPLSDWRDESEAYDDYEWNYAYSRISGRSWSNYLVLTHDAIKCDTVRYLMASQSGAVDLMEMDIYTGGEWVNVYSGSATSGSWTELTFDEASVTEIRFRFHNRYSTARYVYLREVDFLQTTSNYELDLEVRWTGVTYSLQNEYLSIYCGNMGTEDLAVDVWTVSGWETVFTDLVSGWNNASITDWLTDSTFTIRFRGGTEMVDSTQDTWEIDAALIHVWNEEEANYELDLEVQWTSANYDEANEELCIYVDSVSGEHLRVDVWTGSAWVNLFEDLDVGWNNITISSYLTSPEFTIRFTGTTETGDTTQDYWAIDATLLRTWS